MKYLLPLLHLARRHVFMLAALLLATVSTTTAQTFPDAPEAETGTVTVTLIPQGISSGWHFVGEKIWRSSGEQATGLVFGEREIEFRPSANFIQPVNQTINLNSGNANISLTREYYSTSGGTTGNLTVILKPDSITGESTTPKAQWRFLGAGDDKWRNSGDSKKLLPGVYLIECKPVSGKTTPPPVSVTVLGKKNPTITATYFAPDATTGTQPAVLDPAATEDPDLPYAYVGQIRTNHSIGTGFVVLSHTVATAAHLVFDEEKLTYYGGLQWLFQPDPGTYEPIPQIPQRVGILTSYATRRDDDNSPGVLSAASRSCDVAALYFATPPGRNGYSDYRYSDEPDNEFLTSSNLKTLACYPVEGITPANQGRMHATPPSNITFTANPGFPTELYATTGITSSGGAAGAPIFVRNSGGVYTCVAIYTGGSATTEVRSFTEDVDTLFFWSDTNGLAPDGGITDVDGTTSSGSFTVGAIKINTKPGSGRWKLGTSATTRASGSTADNLLAGTYTINFTKLAGYKTPSPLQVVVSDTTPVTKTISYTPLGPITKITEPKSNATVSKGGFFVSGKASDPNGIRMYEVRVTGKDPATLLPGKTYFSGKVSKGTITVKMRAKNRAGIWGAYTSITVKAK